MEKAELLSEQDLQVCIGAYRDGRADDHHLKAIFKRLTEAMMQTRRFAGLPSEVATDAAELCLDKLPRYDGGRGKAFNFFTTIIACWLTQEKHRLRRRGPKT